MAPDDLLQEELEQEELEQNDEQLFEHYRFVVDKGQAPLRIDRFITSKMEQTSRHRVQLALQAQYVRVGDCPVKANYKVKPGDVITIMLPYQRRGFEVRPEPIPLNIVYEDDDLLIVNKSAGMVVHPGFGHFSGTLINALAYHLGISQEADATDERMGVLVHRIDKDTSGLLVVAKNELSQLKLAGQFFEHTIQRTYWALVWGNVAEDSGTIEGNLGRDPNDRMRFKVFEDGSAGKTAITHYRVLERFGYTTLVECRLETGRTHQIRVHMNYIGHPLFNDDRYGGDRVLKGPLYAKYKQFIDNCFAIMPRQALHAKTLGFKHPGTGQEVFFDSELPADFTALLAKWRSYATGRDILQNVMEEEE
ncbi:MAG: RluA family pseudouridine synthase [Bacteroidales bacterium]|nr:RluA family pseudouridine synthase [Bacteroidales bacterium]